MSMPFAQVQTKTGGTTSNAATTTVTFTNPTANGNMILVVVATASVSFATVSSMTDNTGNTYTKIDSGSNTIDGELWYAKNVGSGTPTVTITWSGTGNAVAIILAEYSGVNTSPLDRHASTTGTSATLGSTASSGVTNQTSELVIAWGSLANSSAVTAGGGYANLITTFQSTTQAVLADKTVTASGAQSPSFSNTSAGWVGGVATFTTGTKVLTSMLRPHPFSPGLAR